MLFGSSTGGLNALSNIFAKFKGRAVELPILITQHIADSFDASFADKLSHISGIECVIGKNRSIIESGKAYIAPANYHMELVKNTEEAQPRIKLTTDPPINFCKPAVDPLFLSVSNIYDKNTLAVILTGIGNDGLVGAKEIVEKGGTIIAQDKETSVVWGMPGAVAKAGLCSEILPLENLADSIIDYSFGKIR